MAKKTVREHFAGDHQQEQAHWAAFAKGLGRVAEHCQTMHKEAGMSEDEKSPYSKMGEEILGLSALAQSHAVYHGARVEECMKATDDELGKSANTPDLEKRVRHLEGQLVPTSVSAVAPDRPGGVRAVPRYGQQPIERPNVPIQFETLSAIEE
jgi:hypothetical protein